MRLETPRLVIRSFAISDIPQYAKIVSDPRVTRYLADGLPHSYMEAENYIRDCMRRDKATGVARYAVVRKSEGDLIGFCGFKELDDCIDFGWRYAQHVWNQGYGTEVALAVLDYGVRALRLRNIAATTFTANVASLKIIRKLGFIRALEGEHHGRRTVRYDQQRSPNNTLQRTRQKRPLGCD